MLTQLQTSKPTRTELEHQMLLIRVVEEKLQSLCDSGELSADLHFGRGQEAIAVGVCAALDERDVLLCHHRMLPWAIARGVPLEPLIAAVSYTHLTLPTTPYV